MHIFIKNSFLFKIPTFLPHFKPVTMMHTVMFRVPMLSSERLDVVEELGQVRFNQFCTPCTVQYYSVHLYCRSCGCTDIKIVLFTCSVLLYCTNIKNTSSVHLHITVLYCTLVLQTLLVYKY